MLKWFRDHWRITLIVFFVGAVGWGIAGLVISLMYDFSSGFPFLLIGLFQLFIGVWLFKRRGKGILS